MPQAGAHGAQFRVLLGTSPKVRLTTIPVAPCTGDGPAATCEPTVLAGRRRDRLVAGAAVRMSFPGP
jgi:hypothetical protein